MVTYSDIQPFSFLRLLDHDGIYFRYLASPRTVSLVGVPLALGQNLDGVDTGPDELRRGGLAKRIKAESWGLIDNGDIEVPKSASKLSGAKNFLCAEPISEVNKATAEKTFAEAKNNKFVLTVGGDHSIAIGSIAGILKARPDTGTSFPDSKLPGLAALVNRMSGILLVESTHLTLNYALTEFFMFS
jgi:arginase family enzyme